MIGHVQKQRTFLERFLDSFAPKIEFKFDLQIQIQIEIKPSKYKILIFSLYLIN